MRLGLFIWFSMYMLMAWHKSLRPKQVSACFTAWVSAIWGVVFCLALHIFFSHSLRSCLG